MGLVPEYFHLHTFGAFQCSLIKSFRVYNKREVKNNCNNNNNSEPACSNIPTDGEWSMLYLNKRPARQAEISEADKFYIVPYQSFGK